MIHLNDAREIVVCELFVHNLELNRQARMQVILTVDHPFVGSQLISSTPSVWTVLIGMLSPRTRLTTHKTPSHSVRGVVFEVELIRNDL